MKRIYLGYSLSDDSDFIRNQFDIDGEFMDILAEDYLSDGTFEVYGKHDDFGSFSDYETLVSYFPFSIDISRLKKTIDIDVVNCVFWVNFEPNLVRLQSKDLVVVDDFYIKKFDYET